MKEAYIGLNSYEKAMYTILLIYAGAVNLSVAITGICYALGILIMLVQYIREKELPAVNKKLLYAVLAYNAIWLVVNAFSVDFDVSIRDWGSAAYRFMPLFFCAMYIRRLSQMKYIMLMFAVSVIGTNIIAFGQALHVLPSNCGERITGITENPNIFASQLLMFIPAMYFMAEQEWSSRWYNGLFAVGCLCSIGTLLLTLCRGSWCAFATMFIIGIMLAKQQQASLIKVGIVGLVGAMLLLMVSDSYSNRVASIFDKKQSSNVERYMIYGSSINMAKEYPLTGVGQDNFYAVFNAEFVNPESKLSPAKGGSTGHPHSNILLALTEGGVIGLLACMMLYSAVLILLWRKYDTSGKTDNFALMGIFVCLGILLEGLTETNMDLMFLMREMWFLIGLGFAKLDYMREDRI